MAKRSSSGITVIGCMIGIITVILGSTVAVQTGAYAKLAPYLGLKPIYSLSELMPGPDDMQKNNLGLGLKKPDLSSNSGSTWKPNTTPTPNNTNTENSGTSDESQSSESEPQSQQQSQTQTPQTDDKKTTTTSMPSAASSPYSISKALQTVETLQTATPHVKGYNRADEFGTWQNSDQLCGYGTTRDLILKRDMTNVVMDAQCHVQSGDFLDPYTGKTIKFQRDQYSGNRKVSGDSAAIQIDHVVALQDAWASGLWQDSRKADRVKYANDPEVLLASDGTANNVKSMGVNLYSSGVAKTYNNRGAVLKWVNSTPSVWLPDNTSYDCEYMAKRVYIKDKYKLTMSSWEKQETIAFLKQCAAK